MKREIYVCLVTGVGWTIGHYVAVHMYERICVPLSPIGFVFSPLVLDTPHCSALRWVILNGPYHIRECWKVIATICVVASVSGSMQGTLRDRQ